MVNSDQQTSLFFLRENSKSIFTLNDIRVAVGREADQTTFNHRVVGSIPDSNTRIDSIEHIK